MSPRELVVLGTASQAPTRRRNHNGYFLRWDGEGLLFDPGEGTQRQMLFAGVTASEISRIYQADMLVCECTFAEAEAGFARDYGHLTARQAGRIAAEAGARLLVLTHFSQRYETAGTERLAAEAASAFGGEVVLADDLDRIPVPARRPPPSPGVRRPE